MAALFVPTAYAEDKPVRVRGTIDRVEGGVYVVKAKGGDELKLPSPTMLRSRRW